jgi:hypothetical protein
VYSEEMRQQIAESMGLVHCITYVRVAKPLKSMQNILSFVLLPHKAGG